MGLLLGACISNEWVALCRLHPVEWYVGWAVEIGQVGVGVEVEVWDEKWGTAPLVALGCCCYLLQLGV